ncbi:hypothetical protein VMA_000981 [Vibrio mimicus VM223]|nr:hypothetical protein VMA_000981 [Vibrio mimicus VM223]
MHRRKRCRVGTQQDYGVFTARLHVWIRELMIGGDELFAIAENQMIR